MDDKINYWTIHPVHSRDDTKDVSHRNTHTIQEINIKSFIVIKITVSLIVIGLKNSCFALIHLPRCHRTACYKAVQ